MMQQNSVQKNYLQAEVHTATPQKLQLMLVEAAIKNVHRTKIAWKEEKFDVGFETLARAQDIVAEILCSLDVKGNPQIAKQLASIYLFIFRSLAEGGMTHEEQKLDDALRVLNSERETWRQVCEKFGSTFSDTEPGAAMLKASTSGDSVDFSTEDETKVLVAQGASAPASFTRPQGLKPLGASGIQTSASLSQKSAGETPPQTGAASGGWDA